MHLHVEEGMSETPRREKVADLGICHVRVPGMMVARQDFGWSEDEVVIVHPAVV